MCGCYRRGIVVMDVLWRRICVSMRFEKGRFICLELGKGATSDAGKYLFRAAYICGGGVHII